MSEFFSDEAVAPIFIDQRDAFSLVFHRLLQSCDGAPDGHLRTMPMQASDQIDSNVTDNIGVNPVLLVPGLLGNSFRNLIAPAMFARAELALQGYVIDVAWVNGRTGCDLNARQLRDHVLSASDMHGSAITLIGYSKGCADAMHMLVNHPETQSSVANLVSLAGVVGGTPLAGNVSSVTRALLDSMPIPGVARGDGRAIADLGTHYRRDWLRTHHLPLCIRYASVIAVPESAKVSRILRGGFHHLSKSSVANDSQVIDCDAILPNSELLAVINADHWAIALPISRRFGRWVRPLVNHNDYPRTVLLQAIIDYLAAGLVKQ